MANAGMTKTAMFNSKIKQLYFWITSTWGFPEAQCQMGDAYMGEFGSRICTPNPKKAVEWYRKSADQGFADACCKLGRCYEDGVGVQEDKQQAISWYEKAARHDDAEAQYRVGYCNSHGIGTQQNMKRAVYWYKEAAQQEHHLAAMELENPEIQHELGRYYCGVCDHDQEYFLDADDWLSVENPMAVEWYTKAACQGHADAQFKLAWRYYEGIGVEEDKEKAVDWFTKAANKGHPEAQYRLGLFFDEGSEPDDEKAFYWLSKAAEQEHVNAQYELALKYKKRSAARIAPIWKNYRQYIHLCHEAAEKGHPEAQYTLGKQYHRTSEINSKSEDWFLKAANQGHIDAQVALMQPPYRIFKYAQEAARNGSSKAQFWLGQNAPLEDRSRAIYWYRKAAEQGHHEALDSLGAEDWKLAMNPPPSGKNDPDDSD